MSCEVCLLKLMVCIHPEYSRDRLLFETEGVYALREWRYMYFSVQSIFRDLSPLESMGVLWMSIELYYML